MWFEPIECQAARLLLAQGRVVEAARELLGGSQPQHQAVLKLRLEVLPLLVVQARQAADVLDHALAAELLDLAAGCGELDPDSRKLRNDAARILESKRQAADWAAGRAALAQELAEAGRWQTAIGVLRPLAEQPEHGRRLQDWEDDAGRLQRYLHDGRAFLERGELAAARRCWEKAAELSPQDPEVLQLATQLGSTAPPGAAASDSTSSWPPRAATPDPAPPRDDGAVVLPLRRGTPFVLRGDTQVAALVVSRGDVVLGSGRHAVVDVPLRGGLHSRHARLVLERGDWHIVNDYRDRQGGTWSVKVVRCGDAIVLEHGAAQRLEPDDRLRLGHEELWFTRPVGDSSTCVLSSASRGNLTDGFTHVLLCVDELIVGLPRQAAHLHGRELAVDRLDLTLRWDSQGMLAVPGGRWLHLESAAIGQQGHRLSLAAKVPPAELLGSVLTGRDMPVNWLWELSPWT